MTEPITSPESSKIRRAAVWGAIAEANLAAGRSAWVALASMVSWVAVLLHARLVLPLRTHEYVTS